MLPITRCVSRYNYSSNNPVKYIVIHDTGNKTDSASGNANYFNGADRGSSAHYFVDDNSIYQVVEEYNASWHCGDGGGKYGITNHNSIGIEMCRVNNTVTTTTENNTIELVKYLMNKYAIPSDRVVRHYDASRKCCPSSFSANNWSRWNSFKSKLTSSNEIANDVYIVDELPYETNARLHDGYYKILDSNGKEVPRRQLDYYDEFLVLEVQPSWKRIEIIYKACIGWVHGYISIDAFPNIDFKYRLQYQNDGTNSNVFLDQHCQNYYEPLPPNAKATPLYRGKGGYLHIAYTRENGTHTSGYVTFEGLNKTI